MCLRKEKREVSKMKQAPNSPWRHIIRQQLKPKLSRSVVSGAKINLNRYWSKFEQLSKNSNLMTFAAVSEDSIPPLMTAYQHTPVEDNEINDNILNETMELDL